MAAWIKIKGDRLVALVLGVLVIFVTVVYLLLQKAEDFSPGYFTNTVILTVFGFVNAILVLALLYVLFRNLILLVAERRRGTLGSQFKTKLVVIFLGLTLIPSILLFVAAGKLIEHSIKKWFSTPVEEVVQAGQAVLEATSERYRRQAIHFARQVAQGVAADHLLAPGQGRRLRPALERRLREYDLDLIMLSAGGEARMTVADSEISLAAVDALPGDLVEKAQAGRPSQRIDEMDDGRMVRAAFPVPGTSHNGDPPAVISVGYLVPLRVAGLTRRIARSADKYLQTKALENPIQRSYYLVLILVAVVVIFSAVWVGLALARRITEPIQKLAEGTREVAAGNLAYQVRVDVDDEFGILVDSFNRMTRDLRMAKENEEASHLALSSTNREMERRRRYIETLLENLTPGVISINQDGRVTTINRSACGILGLSRPEDLPGLELAEILSRPEHRGLAALAAEMARSGERGLERSLTLSSAGRTLTITATLTPLRDGDGGRMGMIMVLEDVTQLIRAEKAAAWQEVARRLAHEIKNPLTPIQLSAQRIAKKFKEQSSGLEEAVLEGTGVIVSEVSALKTLLDEFSQFARLPAVNRVPSDLHQVLDQAIALYDGLHPGVRFQRDYDLRGGRLSLDREQMKRVCVNLFDNAVEAMGVKGTICVKTRQSRNGDGFRLEVSDEGKGIPLVDRDRMFLPYFSTKKKGTGLGLAIVNRIVSDHDGSIRFEANRPQGSRFVIDLPALI